MRATPEEDSRFEYLETGIVMENVDSKALMEDINENFMDSFEDEAARSYNTDDLDEKTQVANKPANWPRLLELAEELKQFQPWKWIDDDQIFAIQDPETKEYVYCSIMGAGGMEYGLSAFIGVDIAKYKHVARAQDFRGLEFSAPLYFENTNASFNCFIEWIKTLMIQNKMEKVIIGMEPTGDYGLI